MRSDSLEVVLSDIRDNILLAQEFVAGIYGARGFTGPGYELQIFQPRRLFRLGPRITHDAISVWHIILQFVSCHRNSSLRGAWGGHSRAVQWITSVFLPGLQQDLQLSDRDAANTTAAQGALDRIRRFEMKALFGKFILVLALVLSLPIPAMADEQEDLIAQVRNNRADFSAEEKDAVTKIAPECGSFFDGEVSTEARCAAGFAMSKSNLYKNLAALNDRYINDLRSRLKNPLAPSAQLDPPDDLKILYERDKIATYQDLLGRREKINSKVKDFQSITKSHLDSAAFWRQTATQLFAFAKNESAKAKDK